jgi:DNA-binding transcriptional regulator GbsR (MarR family)
MHFTLHIFHKLLIIQECDDRLGYDGGMATDADKRQFLERFALVLADGGIPRMPARVFACILSDDRAGLTAGELAAQLDVSPAAISGAVRYLVQVRLIQRDRVPGSRADHYRLADDLWYTAIADRTELLKTWEDSLVEGVQLLGPASIAGRRLNETRAFFEFMRGEVPSMLDRWHAHRADLIASGDLVDADADPAPSVSAPHGSGT